MFRRFPIALVSLALLLSAFTSPATGAVRAVQIKAIPSSIEVGQQLVISGTVAGKLRGKSVRIEMKTTGSWKKLATVKSTSSGTWSFKYKAPKKLTKISFRAISKGKTSAVRKISVKASTKISVTGPGDRIQGLDLSRWQDIGQPLDFPQMANAGIEFAFIKASDGNATEDALALPIVQSYSSGLKSAGIIVGYYHRARVPVTASSRTITRSAKAQAKLASQRLEVLGGYDNRTLPYVLDLEGVDPTITDALVTLWATTWLTEMKKVTGREPIFYSYRSFIKDRLTQDATTVNTLRNLHLWLAQPANPADPLIKVGWNNANTDCYQSAWRQSSCQLEYVWTFWQYTNTGDREAFGIPWSPKKGGCPKSAKYCFPGKSFGQFHLDLNVFNGTPDQLKELAAGNWDRSPAEYQ